MFKITALTLGVSGLVELLIGAFGYTEGSQEIWRFEPLRMTLETVSFPIWTGGLSVLFGAAMLVLTPGKATDRSRRELAGEVTL
jgi:hypothetical protein